METSTHIIRISSSITPQKINKAFKTILGNSKSGT